MTEPMSPEWLDRLDAMLGHTTDSDPWFYEEIRVLTSEVRRLQRENHILHLSRGSSPHSLVGMD